MKVLLHIFLIVCLAAKLSSGNILLIKDYLKTKSLSTLLLISCGNETFPIADVRSLNGIWVNVWDVSKEPMLTYFNYNKFFGRYSHPHGVVLNLDCDRTESLLIQLSKRILFHNERFWLMYTSNLEEASIILSSQNIKVDAEIVLAVPVDLNHEVSYNIYEVFKLSSVHGRETHFNLSQLGDWNKSDGFNIPGKQSKTERRRNLRGITLSSVVSLTNIPNGRTYMQHLQSEESYHLDNMNRMSYRLVVVLMDMYNFKIHIRLATIWGALDSNKRWLGAIGLLNRSEVDFGITSVKLAFERYGAFEFTTHSHRNQLQLAFLHPKSIDTVNVFLHPFESMVWYATIGLCLVCVFIVKLTSSVGKQLTENSDRHAAQNDDSYSNSVMIVFGFIFQQNFVGNARLASTRILIITMILFSILIFLFYSLFIIGSLLTDPPKNIKTIRQLTNSPFKFKIDAVPYVHDAFKRATEPDVVKLYSKVMKVPEHALVPLEAGVHLMRQGGVALVTDSSYANIYMRDTLTDSDKCELQTIDLIQEFQTGLPVPIKSPLKELIRIGMTETGILSYYNKIWSGIKLKCEVSGPVFSPVDIVHFSSAIFVVIVGIISSLIVLIFENILHRFSKRRASCRN